MYSQQPHQAAQPHPSYGHPPPSAYPYAHQSQYPPSQHHYASPPPDPYNMSDEAFRGWFTSQLSALVVNQKNIIHNLAYIANEHSRYRSHIISQCLERHIRKAHPAVKLPAWYLLDSISKNIGPPYTQIFPDFVATLFLDSYYAVDLPTRQKMEEMFVTWRTAGPGGMELFGANVQHTVERGLGWGGDVSSSSGPSHRPYPTKSQVLAELDVILTQKTRAVEMNPYDNQSAGHVDTLHQLRSLVQSSQLSGSELSAIVTQLRTLARNTASSAPPPGSIPPPTSLPQYPAQAPVQGFNSPVPPPAAPTRAISPPAYPVLAPPALSGSFQKPTPPLAAQSIAVPDISSMLKSLAQSGIMTAPSSTGTSAAAPPPVLGNLSSLSALLASATGASLRANTPQSTASSIVAEPNVDPEVEYERIILGIDVNVTASGIQREQPQAIALLYDHLTLQCKQCAQRFPDDGPEGKGKKRYQDHQDAHFRQNLKYVTAASTGAVGSMGRGYTRSWFIGKEDWTRDTTNSSEVTTNDDKSKARALSPTTAAPESKLSYEERMAKLRLSYVPIPSDSEAQSILCPICKEPIQTEFNDEEEEWIWRNAVSVKGKVYHATCRAEALASASVAQRLRSEDASRSRSRSLTPETLATMIKGESGVDPRKASPLKRKADKLDQQSDSESESLPSLDGIVVKGETTGSPRPSKKIILTVPGN